MIQHIIVFIILLISVTYLLYHWKLKNILITKKQKIISKPTDCASGCSHCSLPKKPKKFT